RGEVAPGAAGGGGRRARGAGSWALSATGGGPRGWPAPGAGGRPAAGRAGGATAPGRGVGVGGPGVGVGSEVTGDHPTGRGGGGRGRGPGPRDDAALSGRAARRRSEEHTSELQSRENLVCRPLLEKKKQSQDC